MDRTEFLKICQKVSILKDGICGTKENVTNDLKVVYKDILYYPVAYKLSFDKGQVVHIGVLHELNTNCVVNANLEKINLYELNGKET